MAWTAWMVFFGDLGVDGDLAAGLVPQDGDVEDLEQLGFEPGR